jgi:hypothetical protein
VRKNENQEKRSEIVLRRKKPVPRRPPTVCETYNRQRLQRNHDRGRGGRDQNKITFFLAPPPEQLLELRNACPSGTKQLTQPISRAKRGRDAYDRSWSEKKNLAQIDEGGRGMSPRPQARWRLPRNQGGTTCTYFGF